MDQDQQIKIKLAAAYRIFAKLNMDDLTYTHLSARSSKKNSFFIYPLGSLFNEVTASSLIEVTLDGKVISGVEKQYNVTGYVIHGNIYKSRQDINSIFHLHTTAGVAVSCDKRGLLPISQFALHLYSHISYHKYDSLELDAVQSQKMIDNFGKENYVMIMENHGTLTSGRTIEENMFYAHHLENACKVQIMLNGVDDKNIIYPSKEVCTQTRYDLLRFEKNLGERDWSALVRDLDKRSEDYKK